MNAKEAKELVNKVNEAEKIEADKRREEFERRKAEYIEGGKLAVPNYLAEIHQKIKEAAARKERKLRYWTIYKNKEFGNYFLTAAGHELERLLKAEGYEVKFSVEHSGGTTVYEGLMNPEAVGWEYSYNRLNMDISW